MREKPILNITVPEPTCAPCFECTKGKFKEKKTVVIVAITVEQLSDSVTQIGYGCSRGLSCEDRGCRYSKRSTSDEGEFTPVESLGHLDR
jgi:hypothetical protein